MSGLAGVIAGGGVASGTPPLYVTRIMDETPAPEALDQRRRRLLFRATHRGTRENDILFGGFVATGLAKFTTGELAALEALLEIPDPLLADWLTGRSPIPPETPIVQRIRDAALKKEAVLF
jgi:antitoxin CptB